MKKIILGVLLLTSTMICAQVQSKQDSTIIKTIGYDFKSLPKFSGVINTLETVPIYSIPDLVNGTWLGNISGTKIEIISKADDKYYLVKFNNNKTGYVFVGYIMKYGTKIKKIKIK